MRYSDYVSTKQTPQSDPVLGKDQVQNNAGGYVFKVSIWDQLVRFLILGSEGGTYYVSQKALTIDNAKNVVAAIKEDGAKAVKIISEVSSSGRAPKNDQAIFALALATTVGSPETKKLAYMAISDVVRTGTHMFQFVQNIQDLRGWSRGLRSAVARWYTGKQGVEYQLAKYQSRNGWTHKDVFRLSHPKPRTEDQKAAFAKVVGKPYEGPGKTPFFDAMARANAIKIGPETPSGLVELAALIKSEKLQREMVPTQALNKPVIQDALLHSMGITAIIRNLGSMTASGFLSSNLDAAVAYIGDQLRSPEVLKSGKVHPLTILNAMFTYSQGRGDKGSLTWTPIQGIVDALNDAFYASFAAVESTGKRHYLALDVSGSMASNFIGNTKMDCRTAAAAMALVTANVEKLTEIVGFSTKSNWQYSQDNIIVPLPISPRDRLDRTKEIMAAIPMGRTDCALPMLDALERNLNVDVFVIYTDNESWAGEVHPFQALAAYRKAVNPKAKLVVVAMTATSFSVSDPDDALSMDVVGFDTSVPSVIAEFVK